MARVEAVVVLLPLAMARASTDQTTMSHQLSIQSEEVFFFIWNDNEEKKLDSNKKSQLKKNTTTKPVRLLFLYKF